MRKFDAGVIFDLTHLVPYMLQYESSSAVGYVRAARKEAGTLKKRPRCHQLEHPLITLKIHHKTTYRYRQLMSLGPHRLMLRPRESRDLRLISSDVVVTPGTA